MEHKFFLRIFILGILPIFLVIGMSLAQPGVEVKGLITDTNEEPIIGANVFIEDLGVGASTDVDGYFSFTVPADQATGQDVELIARYVGYKEKRTTITLSGTEVLQNYILIEDIFKTEAIVVSGIASKTSKDVAPVAVSSVNATDYTIANSYQGINQLVAGKVSGVQMAPTSGRF